MGDYFFLIVAVPVIGFLGLLLWAALRGRPAEAPTARWSSATASCCAASPCSRPLASRSASPSALFYPPKNGDDVTAILCLYGLFAALSAPLLWEAMRFSLAVTPAGLDCRSPWRGHRFLAWDEVKE